MGSPKLIAEAKVTLAAAGVHAEIVNGSEPELTPSFVMTETLTVRAVFNSAAVTVVVNCVALTKLVGRTTPFHTMLFKPEQKPTPVTVIRNDEPPT